MNKELLNNPEVKEIAELYLQKHFNECVRQQPFNWDDFVREHTKQPLFKTDDGVDVYYGDMIFMIADWEAYTYYAHKPKSNTFSNREKAEEYILMNKPCLSVNDLINFGVIVKNSSCQYNRLLELAKSKQ